MSKLRRPTSHECTPPPKLCIMVRHASIFKSWQNFKKNTGKVYQTPSNIKWSQSWPLRRAGKSLGQLFRSRLERDFQKMKWKIFSAHLDSIRTVIKDSEPDPMGRRLSSADFPWPDASRGGGRFTRNADARCRNGFVSSSCMGAWIHPIVY